MSGDDYAAEVRSHFPIFRRKIYLNSCSQGALSDVVESGFQDYLASWHELGSPWELWVSEYERVRASFSELIGAAPDEVAIVTSASAGINAIASSLSFRDRPKVVMGEFEFPTMGHVWLAQVPRGAQVRFVPADRDSIPVENYEHAIDEHALIVPLTHVCFKNGFRSPVERVIEIARERGALVMLDDYQDCGTRPVNVKTLGLDFYVTGTLKYLLGPPGLAFMYVRKELTQTLVPTVTGWFGQRNPFAFDPQTFDPSPSARRFESGSPAIPNVYGAAPSIELLRNIGLDRVAAQVRHLTRALYEGATSMGLQAKTPAASVGPLVVLRARDSEALVKRLAERDIIVSSRLDGVRFSFHIYNTENDVKAVLAALEDNRELLVTEPAVSTRT